MSAGRMASYPAAGVGQVPELVLRAVAHAEWLGLELCVLPEAVRLLATLAGGLPPGQLVGEAGTGAPLPDAPALRPREIRVAPDAEVIVCR